MASQVADTVARLRVCRDAGVPVPPALRDDAIACLEDTIDAALLRTSRDDLIRRAALLLPFGTPHQKATALADEAQAMSRTWHLLRSRPPAVTFTTPRDCLHAAALRAKLPESQRQFYRVLRAACTDIARHGVVSGDDPMIAA